MENKRKKIMMVDDDQSILKMGKLIMKDLYEVFPLLSAAKLFDTLEKVIPDIILLDIMMPEVDGVETIKKLKADRRYKNIPVIFITSKDDDESIFEQLNLGAYSTVPKPFTSKELLIRIENCLNDFLPEVPSENEDDRKMILAVDDAPDILKTIHLALHDTYKVHTLTNPEKLKALLQTLTPELFLLDYKMPTISGFDLIPIIRGFPQHKSTPIIFLTSESAADCFTEAIRLGACDYVIKPFDTEMLREKIARHIKKSTKTGTKTAPTP